MNSLARPYAIALYKTAIADNSASIWYKVLDILILINNCPGAKYIKPEKIICILQTDIDINIKVSNFASILMKNKRLCLIQAIKEQFYQYIYLHNNTQKVVIETPYPIDKHLDTFKLVLEKRLKKYVLIETVLNQSLIAGIKIIINDDVIEYSIKQILTNFANKVQNA